MAKKKAKDETIINVDEVYTKTEQFVDKYRNQLTYGLGGVAILILVFMGYRTLVQEPAELAAEEAMFAAEHYFSKDSTDLAQYGDGFSAGLEEILNDHSGTNAASRAAYLLGVAHRDAGLFEEAIESFKTVAINDDVIGPYAQAGIGDCYTELGDFASAEGYFASAASAADAGLAEKVIAPSFHYKRALVLIELGRSDEAKNALDHIVSDHPNSRLVNKAEALSASI
jgi:tetratricopeptide (TPR) repeat protein